MTTLKNEKYAQTLELIKKSSNILITGHTRPDADSCGSAAALSRMLLNMGKNVFPFLITPCSDDIKFIFDDLAPYTADIDREILPQIEEICKDIDLVILVDTNSRNQLPGFEKWLDIAGCKVIVFDHHITSDRLGDIELIDTQAAAAGQIVCDFFESVELEITPPIANNLFTAIASDTGWFRFGNRNNGKVYAIAGRLIDKGAAPRDIYSRLFEQLAEGKFRLIARAAASMELHLNGQAATQVILLSDLAATGTKGRDTGNIVQEPHKIAGVDTSVIFIEQLDGKFKCSMRSKGRVNVREIAQKYGGGGHDLAAGATIDEHIEELKVLILNEINTQFRSQNE